MHPRSQGVSIAAADLEDDDEDLDEGFGMRAGGGGALAGSKRAASALDDDGGGSAGKRGRTAADGAAAEMAARGVGGGGYAAAGVAPGAEAQRVLEGAMRDALQAAKKKKSFGAKQPDFFMFFSPVSGYPLGRGRTGGQGCRVLPAFP